MLALHTRKCSICTIGNGPKISLMALIKCLEDSKKIEPADVGLTNADIKNAATIIRNCFCGTNKHVKFEKNQLFLFDKVLKRLLQWQKNS